MVSSSDGEYQRRFPGRASSISCRRGERGREPLSELLLHLLGLGAQHRLANAAELAGERGFAFVLDLGVGAGLDQAGERAGGEPTDDAERHALDLGLDLVRRLNARELDHHVELEFHVRDLGLEYRRVVLPVDLVEVVHAIDAGDEEAGVAQLGKHRLARRLDGDLTGEFHAWSPPIATGGKATSAVPAGSERQGFRLQETAASSPYTDLRLPT